ncbi:SHOCT domain-containing protein [Clostridium polynesiense]|uniref:SHOCT domain-containing protein n=1 Tax=Clostridium polynesiense TaxID=1325933 RepID=UPI00058F3DC0|nr:SHOCT domain-containing protein [Clostridium polynesiense]
MFCRGFGPYGYNSGGFLGSGSMLLMLGFRVLIFIGIIMLIYKLFKHFSGNSQNSLKILNEKFAKGEISQEEYLSRKNVLINKD